MPVTLVELKFHQLQDKKTYMLFNVRSLDVA